MFQNMIRDWFMDAEADYNDFVKSLLMGDKKAMNAYMNCVVLSTFSYFDAGKRPEAICCAADSSRYSGGTYPVLWICFSGEESFDWIRNAVLHPYFSYDKINLAVLSNSKKERME